jgi:DnaK suppressor protein
MERLYKALTARQRQLLEDGVARTAVSEAFLREWSADDADVAAGASDQEVACWIAERYSDELTGIADAFRKMQEGGYGVCELCDSPIPAARLSVLPSARLCLACQREQEHQADADGPDRRWAKLGSAGGNGASEPATIGTRQRR